MRFALLYIFVLLVSTCYTVTPNYRTHPFFLARFIHKPCVSSLYLVPVSGIEAFGFSLVDFTYIPGHVHAGRP
jgi:hypothetical protein